jgi:hypothetical protein
VPLLVLEQHQHNFNKAVVLNPKALFSSLIKIKAAHHH